MRARRRRVDRLTSARIRLALLLSFVPIGGSAWLLGCDGPRDRTPNVVLISIDTCRPDYLGVYGHTRATTPHIDSVARDGTLFALAQSTNPTTLPAHSSMLTGTIPPFHGVRNNESYRLGDSNVTLAEMLREQGFHTAAFVGAFPLASRFGLDQGFDIYDDRFLGTAGKGLFNERKAEDVSRAASAWLQERQARPFFLFLHYFDPHAPYAPPEPYASTYRDDPYAGEIAYVDFWIGRIIQELKDSGLYDSSLIVITSDHGESLGEHEERTHSFFMYQSTIRVPLIVKTPGRAGHREVDEAVSLIDVVPTVLGAIGLDVPDQVQGVDLGGRLRGSAESKRDRYLYSESLLPGSFGCSPLRGVVHGTWKYIWSVEPELYDLGRDPAEADNLIDRQPQTAYELNARLRDLSVTRGPAAGAGGRRDADRESVSRLESLGYISGGALQDTFDLHPGMEDPKRFVPVYLRIMEAESFYGRSLFDEARQASLEVLAHRPQLLRAHAILGKIAVEQSRLDEAEEHFSDVLAIAAAADSGLQGSDLDREHHVSVTHFNLGNVFRRKQEPFKAREHFEQALRVNPDYVEAHIALGGLLERQGDLAQAATHFARTLSIAPQDAKVHYGLGVVAAKQGKITQAMAHYERALELRFDYPEAHNNLGVLFAETGDPGRAKLHFEHALLLRPDYATAHNGLGNVLFKLGQPGSAKTHYEEALRARPGYTTARQNLARVDALLERQAAPN